MRMRQGHLEDPEDVLQEDVDLFGAPDRKQVPGDVLVLPERQTFSKIWEKIKKLFFNNFKFEAQKFFSFF